MGGGDNASSTATAWAYELGQSIAREGWILLTGGRPKGVMDAASKGAKAEGGLVVGVIPGSDPADATEGADIVIATGMGSARNNINVLSSEVVIACGEASAGTLSEIGLAVKAGKPVVVLNDDTQASEFFVALDSKLVHIANDPEQAIRIVAKLLDR